MKKGVKWEWSDRCQRAFEDLKRVLDGRPVLALPDVTKPFEVQTDASDFAYGTTIAPLLLIAFALLSHLLLLLSLELKTSSSSELPKLLS